jgi:hypothetical protein
MRICPYCASQLPDDAAVCQTCKRDLEGAVPDIDHAAEAAREAKQNRAAWIAIAAAIAGAALWWLAPEWPSLPFVPASARRSGPAEAPPASAKLAAIWHWSIQQGTAVAEGEVTNISAQPLENVQAVVKFRRHGGDLVTSLGALVAPSPLPPGATGSFTVRVRSDPDMAEAILDFRQLGGQPIPWRHKADPTKKR